MTGRRTWRTTAVRWSQGADLEGTAEHLVVEEPLTILLDGVMVATTMRTPGHDFELAAGWCRTEGLLAGAAIREIRYCDGRSPGPYRGDYNTIDVSTIDPETGGKAPPAVARLNMLSSSCGLCGTADLTAVGEHGPVALPPVALWSPSVLATVADLVRPLQAVFDRTGGLHAAAGFDRDGSVLLVREDIGRHNAVDKVAGRLHLDDRLPATELGLFVSSRASYEIVAKACAAGFTALVAVSAPSALAVRAARNAGLTLGAFARGGAVTVYSHGTAPLGTR